MLSIYSPLQKHCTALVWHAAEIAFTNNAILWQGQQRFDFSFESNHEIKNTNQIMQQNINYLVIGTTDARDACSSVFTRPFSN